MLSCTNLPTLASLTEISRSTGLPVVTSNSGAAEAIRELLDGECMPGTCDT
jgi:maleate cis-trans isomerase